MPKRTPKEKLLIALEVDAKQANADVHRWVTIVNQYDADMLYNQERDLPNLPAIESSRELAKQELTEARELRRLYGVAIEAVRGA